jgi:hypothetical protein
VGESSLTEYRYVPTKYRSCTYKEHALVLCVGVLDRLTRLACATAALIASVHCTASTFNKRVALMWQSLVLL